MKIEIVPRSVFAPYVHRDKRWACMVVHRRGGKTYVSLQDLISRALTHKRPGPPKRYAYLAPTRQQAKDIVWGYLTRFTSAFAKPNAEELKVTFGDGTEIKLFSGESYERLRGMYLDGCVIDEYADIDPRAWYSVIRPCLTDYQGWATFIGTPKGRNQFWRLWCDALQDPAWYTFLLQSSKSGIIPESELVDLRRGTPEHIFRQEYECDFSVARLGSIYARLLEEARVSHRISNDVLWHKECPVYTSFDVGAPFNQRVWVWQMVGDRIVFLESLFGDNDCGTPAEWAKRLLDRKYHYGSHFIPHDAAQANGGLWQAQLRTAGLENVKPVSRQHSVWDGINLALEAFPRVCFNAGKCALGIDSLDNYHAKEETDGMTIKDVPVHDHASHASDAFSLAFQAINAGMVVDRRNLPRRIIDPTRRPARAILA